MITNIRIAGLGGQGIITASDILAEAAFLAGLDVKKSELHGMSQRGGSVYSDVRFGEKVFSPMIPDAQTDFLLVLAEDQIENNCGCLKNQGTLITAASVAEKTLPNRKSINLALLGILSRSLPWDASVWQQAIQLHLKEKLHAAAMKAFELGRHSI